MDASHWLTWSFHKRRISVFQTVSLRGFALGLWLGLISVTMWQPWALTFGEDPEFLLAVCATMSLSLWLGQAWQRKRTLAHRSRSLISMILCLMFWTLLHPFWIDTLTMLMGRLPLSWLEGSGTKLTMAFLLAGLGWTIPTVLWSAVIAEWEKGIGESRRENFRTVSALFPGIACGAVLSVMIVTPWIGLYPAAVAASVLACAVCCFMILPEVSGTDVSTSSETFGGGWLRSGMLVVLGGLVACHLRMINQLMPHVVFVLPVQLAGMIGGVGIGMWLSGFFRRDTSAWGILTGLVWSCLLLGLQPNLVDFSLILNSTFTAASSILTARVLLLIAVTAPFGIALAWTGADDVKSICPRWIAWCAPFVLGLGAGTYTLGGHIEPTLFMAGCTVLLALGGGLLRLSVLDRTQSWRTAAVMSCLAIVTVTLPLYRTCFDASRTAKLLYSTPTFLAYRTGWETRLLPGLDDLRMVEKQEGRNGPLTLWRGRVAELYVREAGVPRAVLTKQSDIVPQFAPEVLQAVYSLVIADQPSRVLILGLSSGVPLSTCLSFPIREVVCVEGDQNLINFVRGPLARETGIDPLADDRVTLRSVNPELAVMTKTDEYFDIVLSCPTASSMTDGAAEYTQEFYQRAARQMARRGLFCQRFECIDFGPEPIQLLFKAIQTAFRKVIAIETTPGELLLLAANSEDLFVSDDLPARLELAHVRKVLSRSGLDWSVLLNQAAYDHNALREMGDRSPLAANSVWNGHMVSRAPMELMRWANKQQEVQTMLTAIRTSPAPYNIEVTRQRGSITGEPVKLTLRSRLIEWLDEGSITKELVRRIEEVATQRKVVRDHPDEHWWKYRTELKKQLQDRPRSAVQQVTAIDEKRKMHPEDIHRRDYFVALGEAATRSQPTREQIAKVETFLEPYDPLLSYFARQETAEMLGRTNADPIRELMYRLHVIYFAPAVDGSVRNVAKAIVTLVNHPEVIPDDALRFDALNGLVQTLRVRWEIRQSVVETSSYKLLEDVDQSLLAVEKGLASLDAVYTSAGISAHDWKTRKQVIERLLLRPLRTYRNEVYSHQVRGEAQSQSIIDEALKFDESP